MTELHQQIMDKIAELEQQEQTLKDKSQSEASIEALVKDITLPKINYESRFRTNLAAFRRYLPEVAEAFETYRAQRYEIVVAEGDVNIVDNTNEQLLYPDNSYQYSYSQFYRYCGAPQTTYFDWSENEENAYDFVHVKYLNKLMQTFNKLVDREESKRHFPEVINSMIIFGVGVGFHLEALFKERKVKRLFVVEPELDLFFTSMYTIDWLRILKIIDESGGRIHLCLGTDSESFFDALSEQMIINGQYEAAFSYCYSHYRNEKMQEMITLFNKKCYELVFGFGFFDDALMSLSHQYVNMKNGVPLLRKQTDCPDVPLPPLLILGNGPSLDSNIEQIKSMADNAIIFSCGTTLKSLHKYGIKPDFHVEMERTRPIVNILDSINDADYLKSLRLLALNTVHPEVFAKFGQRIMGAKVNEASTALMLADETLAGLVDTLAYCNPTVANCALAFATHMGFKDIVLFGVDLGFVGEKHHSQHSIYYDDKGGDKALFSLHSDQLVTVPGNFGGELQTTTIFNYSRVSLEEHISRFPDINYYNASDGVLIKGATPVKAEQLTTDVLSESKTKICDALYARCHLETSAESITHFEHVFTGAEFSELVDKLLEMISESPIDREQALVMLQLQFDAVVSLYNSKQRYLCEMLRGSLLYSHSVLIKLLMMPKDPEQGLANFAEGLDILREYLEAARQRYSQGVDTPDLTDLKGIWN